MSTFTLLCCFLGTASALRSSMMPSTAAAASITRTAVSMKTIPDKKMWVQIASAADAKPETVISGFKFGVEVAVVCDKAGKVYGLSNKLPPFGQPTTFAYFDPNNPSCICEPVTGTSFDFKTGKPVGSWCPLPPLIGPRIFRLLTSPQPVQKIEVRKKGKSVEALINVNAKLQFEADYWKGVLDAQGKADGGYY
eukprot:CAMPEP_0183367112 /NCGR_PEP_ID=MMETSP0164_2-20130417/91345_1 /TAXON_ID=221442 /ORGANISM="Coccolithus pelagicus ssp braarudi, Strain PLY182g" /LENGTH=193 /DNA_ID=CAMNT_0025543003 /DNA_START=41 /DNA_END=622 /DNA_ORIENTATION=+